ncbi:MAG: winged helix-turn-helix transcriptional regulator [Candidatus Heimdallarchaeota archaeon]
MPRFQKRLSLLLNPIRRRIYEVVCESPGIHCYRIASELATSQGTLDWHLRKLEKEGLINSTKFGGKRIYYPRKLSSVESARALAALRSKTAQAIFRLVINTPGMNQQEIANMVGVHHDTVRYHLTQFEKVGLVERFRDGREVRVFLGKLGEQLINGSLELVTDHFVAFLVQKLKEGCLTPIITSQDKDHVSLQVNCPDGDNFEITINLTSWDFLLSDEKK